MDAFLVAFILGLLVGRLVYLFARLALNLHDPNWLHEPAAQAIPPQIVVSRSRPWQ